MLQAGSCFGIKSKRRAIYRLPGENVEGIEVEQVSHCLEWPGLGLLGAAEVKLGCMRSSSGWVTFKMLT